LFVSADLLRFLANIRSWNRNWTWVKHNLLEVS